MKNAIFVLVMLAIPCSAAVITVEPDGSGDAPTIQEAVDVAAVGDEIVLAIGTFTGDGNRDIDFGGKSITVRSTNPNDPNIVTVTIIDCQGTWEEPHRGFSFISGEGANSIVSGLTITNGYGPDEEISGYMEYVGGAIYCYSSSPTVTNCTFGGNFAEWSGGGMYNYDNSSPTVTNCTFSGNSALHGGGMSNGQNSSPTVNNCTFTDNSATAGGGMSNNWSSSPTVTKCAFSGNSSFWGGGMCNYNSSPTVTNCIFGGNSAGSVGGGMYNREYSSPTVTNCTFSGNSAGVGGGMFNQFRSSPIVDSCTFTGNFTEHGGGGMYNYDNSSPTVTNCILWANSPEQVYAEENSNPVITYSDIQGGWEGEGHSNIDVNPNFVDDGYWDDINGTPGDPWDDFWVDGDYHLQKDSPCIDTGDPDSGYLPDATDLDGNPRIDNGIVDMGAYEFIHPVKVSVDIKPRACPNPVNVKSKGILPVAILGTDVFDVNDIDISSIRLEGIAPIRSSFEDVATPETNPNECACTTEGPDGYMDLMLKFETQEIIAILGEVIDGEEWMLNLTGTLYDGTEIEGTDCIILRKKEKKE